MLSSLLTLIFTSIIFMPTYLYLTSYYTYNTSANTNHSNSKSKPPAHYSSEKREVFVRAIADSVGVRVSVTWTPLRSASRNWAFAH